MRYACRWTLALLLAVMLAWTTSAPAADPPATDATTKPDTATKTETPAVPETPRTPEEMQKQLMTLAADARLTDAMVALFKEYAFARAKEKLGADLPDAFWSWLARQTLIRDALMVEMHPDYEVAILKCLDALHGKFPQAVDENPHLAAAFAVVFGRAKGGSPWGPQGYYLRRDRQAPTMEESFQYYVENEKLMRFSLKKTPWPLLAFLADNETPLKERAWAVKTYAGYNDSRLSNIYNELRYDWDQLAGNPRIGDHPRSLPNLRHFGGVCVERAYFASRVYKSMGIPAMSVSGEGQRGGHAWVAWFGRKDKAYCMNSEGRFFYDNYYVGTTWYPPTRRQTLDREVELVAVAVGSFDDYLAARIGCHVYRMFSDEERKTDRTRLLKDAADRNPFVAECWRLLAQARIEEIIPQKEAESIFDVLFRALGEYPDLTYEVLEKVLGPRLTPADDRDKDEIDRNLKLLARAFDAYNQAKRPDLAVRLCLLQGSYLEAVDRRKDALKLYVTASENYAREHYGFRDLFDRALLLMADRESMKMRLKFCDLMVQKVPRQRGDVDKKLKQFNPSYVYVVRAFIRALEEAGNDRLARQWEAKITIN